MTHLVDRLFLSWLAGCAVQIRHLCSGTESSSSLISSLLHSHVTLNLKWCDTIKLSDLLMSRKSGSIKRLQLLSTSGALLPTILKLTCWVRGTNSSTLERTVARAQQIGEPKQADTKQGDCNLRLYDTTCSLISFRKSTPQQNRQLDISMSNNNQKVDNLVGKLTF